MRPVEELSTVLQWASGGRVCGRPKPPSPGCTRSSTAKGSPAFADINLARILHHLHEFIK
jgi:hypothetical protein